MDDATNGESEVKDDLSAEAISSATPAEPIEEATSTEVGVKETTGAASPSHLTKKDEERLETVKCAEQDVPNTAQIEQQTAEKDSTPRMIDTAEDRSMEVEEPTTVPSSADTSTSVREPQIADDRKLESEAVQNIKANALSLLCQYSGSSSDSEPESADTDASAVAGDKKRAASSSSSTGDDESDDESVKAIDDPLSQNYRDQESSILVSDAETMDTNAVSSDDDEDDGRIVSRVPLRTKGEVLPHELPPIEELTITVPEAECKLIGRVDSIVSQIVLVQSLHGVELLNLDTVLFLERGARPLGKIFDVIGQVRSPLYCVLFNSNQEVIARNVTVGMEVFCAPRTEHTSFIILSELMRSKGSDASWRDDNEPPGSVCDYSDDEAERSARKGRKKCQRPEQSSNGAPTNLQQPYPYHQQQPPPHHQSRAPHFRSPAPSNRRNYYPRNQPSGYSWHHNFNSPRNQYPHHWPQQPRHPYPQQQQQYPQAAGPQGSSMLPNPFATLRPPHPPPGHGQ
ncbi:H/ACA ribonucleoprotein complex non-core subunit NAF1 [Anopheles bellator]|uniref:H/ACA ribonucleoprotein complex non-core subunit NAF1 n=1 Tax=Anopheles bellator TaxID=139047 RepID=UPI00264A2E0F|nr:H/ACA ribonucleoprotein complex non-core subunit NAF1 [Anopheles bellator]XP_058066087.1 H/ACA ribonucleoprotein complex non-core subunit NAF1 [Anopheles bellator]